MRIHDEPLPVLAEMRGALSERYGRDFDSIGFNLYRDGRTRWRGMETVTVTT